MWKKKKWLFIVPLLVVSTGVYMVYSAVSDDEIVLIDSIDGGDGDTDIAEDENGGLISDTNTDIDDGGSSTAAKIYVDVGGSVYAPQVVVLDEGARIYEAIEAAGGTLSDAETKYMNMAEVCEDGAKIYVPSSEEVAEQKNAGGSNELFATSSGILTTQSSAGSGASSANYSGKVNINTADTAQLQTLNGIGPSMAQRIVDYRNANGKFSSVNDLTNVSGIGDKTLAKIIENICV